MGIMGDMCGVSRDDPCPEYAGRLANPEPRTQNPEH